MRRLVTLLLFATCGAGCVHTNQKASDSAITPASTTLPEEEKPAIADNDVRIPKTLPAIRDAVNKDGDASAEKNTLAPPVAPPNKSLPADRSRLKPVTQQPRSATASVPSTRSGSQIPDTNQSQTPSGQVEPTSSNSLTPTGGPETQPAAAVVTPGTPPSSSLQPPERYPNFLVNAFYNDRTSQFDKYGKNTAAILFLELSNEIYKRDSTSAAVQTKGVGAISWNGEALAPRTYGEAEAIARYEANHERGSQSPILITIWGRITSWGNAVFVQPQLSIDLPEAKENENVAWTVGRRRFELRRDVSVPFPALRYRFSPIRLSKEAVERLRDSSGMPLLGAPDPGGTVVGITRDQLARVSQEGKYAEVEAPGLEKTAWVYVPQLSSSEFLHFTAGLLEFLKHDCDKAVPHLKVVDGLANAELAVVADAKLLLAACLSMEEKHQDSIALLRSSHATPWRSPRADQYLAMAYANAIVSGDSDNGRYRHELDDLIVANGNVAHPYNPWWQEIGNTTELGPRRSILLVGFDSVRDMGLIINAVIILTIVSFVLSSVLKKMVSFGHLIPTAYVARAIATIEFTLAILFGIVCYFAYSRNTLGSILGGGFVGLLAATFGAVIRAILGRGDASPDNKPNIKPNGPTYSEIRLQSK
jgi:hypothetical protein